MDQSKPLENLILPRRSLKVASAVLLVGRLMGRAIWQVVETVLPRSSGWPPPLVVVRAPKRLWAVGRFVLTLSSFKKEISPMSMLSAFDINGGGENDQFIVPFGVEYLYYERLRSAALSQASVDAFEYMLFDLLEAVTRRLMFFMHVIRTTYNI